MKAIWLLIIITVSQVQANDALDYLNGLRTKAGLPKFSEQSNLNTAAQNHSDYMQINNVAGHYEDSSKSGYTGYSPMDRALDSSYSSRVVSENLSAGVETDTESIDGLFSAIYHRFGFLNLSFDEIGIGKSHNGDTYFYTYDMGNTGVNLLCQETAASSGYKNVCSDAEKIVDRADFENALSSHKESAPELIIWPAVNSDNIPPVFYEESPDPLPNDSVTGYPISVEFNDGKFDTPPTVSSFTLVNVVTNSAVDNIVVMNENNDPHDDFTAYQFALFPEKRLEWGSQYRAKIIYTYDGVEKTKIWSFSTRSLQSKADKFYRIENNADISLNVISGSHYAIYVVPNNTNDSLGNASYSYTSNTPTFSYIDSNTVAITLTGTNGEYAAFTFGNGQKIKLTIASSDNATLLAKDTDNDGIPNDVDTDDDNDGISDTDEIANGLNPLNASDAQADLDNDGFSNSIEIGVGTDIRNANSHPKWVPVIMDNIMIIIPA